MIREIVADSGDPTALTGIGHNPALMLDRPIPFATKRIQSYTLGLVWDDLTDRVTTRILRDCFTLARICNVNRTELKVATSSTSLDQFLKFINVSRTTDEKAATYWRIYCNTDQNIPEIPEHAELSDIIILSRPTENPQKLVYDPEFPANVEYIDVYENQRTMPLYQSPPRGPADWNQQMEPF